MTLKPMYAAIHASIPTRLIESITATQTSFEVEDATVLPPGPNLLTISTEDHAELVRYGAVEGGRLIECVRGFGGTQAQMWPVGTVCCRAYTSVDHAAFLSNIELLGSEAESLSQMKQDAATLSEGAFASFGTAPTQIARGSHTHAQYLTAETDPTVPAWAKAAAKPAYTAAEVGASAAGHTHAQYLTAEADPTVPAWAKTPEKPVYTAAEVGAAEKDHTHEDMTLEETDPTVPEWAKAPQKPVYTAAEVGAAKLIDGKVEAAALYAGIVEVTISRSLWPTDQGKLLMVNGTGTMSVGIPSDAATNFPIGTEIEVMQEGVGAVSISVATDVTLQSLDGMRKLAGQYAAVALKKVGENNWRLSGALT